jgi:exodeoxyribonuclease X
VIIRCIDVETTGMNTETEKHAVCEVGWCDLDVSEDGGEIDEPRSMLVNPGRPMPIEAMAVHHITDKMLVGAPPISDGFARMAEGCDCYAAHKMDFEKEFFGGGGKPMLCSYKGALRIWPDAPRHQLQLLRYMLKIDDMPDFNPGYAMPPHRAGPDAYLCAFVMREIIGRVSYNDLLRWSGGPALLPKITFGKHAMTKFSELPVDYLEWIVGNIKDDRDVRATAKYWLAKKAEQAGTR